MAVSKTLYATKSRRTLAVNPAAGTNDGIYHQTIGGENYEYISNGDLSAENCGVSTLNSAATNAANIAAACARSDVKYVVFNNPKGGVYPLSGNVNCNNKIVKFRNGCELGGTFTLQNAVIEAGYRSKIFPITATLSGCSTTMDMVSVKWAGAVGDDTTDDQPAIQWMAEQTVYNPLMPRDLFFPKAKYKCDNPIIGHNWDGTNYQFFSLNMVGESNTHFTSVAYNTQIRFTNVNAFCIGYQRARSSEIRGLSIIGPFNRSFGSIANQMVAPYYNFSSLSGVRDNPQSPLTAIHIDPFTNTDDPTEEYITAANKYPGLSSWYRGTGTRGGSSAVNVKECRITGFSVGVGYGLNGMTLNAENCTIEKCAIEVCKAATAYGHAQIKDNYIRQCISWDRLHTFIDCDYYGTVSGLRPSPPYVDGINLAGGINRVINCNCSFPASVKNIFAELLFSIGRCENNTVFQFEDCCFNFVDEATAANKSPEWHFYGTNVMFKNCDFRVFDDLFNKKMILRGHRIDFEGCKFDNTPLEQTPNVTPHSITYKNCFLGSGEDFAREYNNTALGTIGSNAVRHRGKTTYTLARGSTALPLGADGKIEFESDEMDYWIKLSNNYQPSFTVLGNGTLQMNFTIGETASLAVGDYLVEYENSAVNFINEDTGIKDPYPVYGKVVSIDAGTGVVILDNVPKHITSGTNAYPYAVRKALYTTPWSGDAPASGNVWTNVVYPPGIAMLGGGVNPATHEYDFGSHWWGGAQKDYMISNSANFKEIITHDSETPFALSLAATFNKPFLRGTEWRTKQAIGGEPIERVFKCIKSGYLDTVELGLGSGLQSDWAQVPVTRQNGGVFEFYDFDANAWTTVSAGGNTNVPAVITSNYSAGATDRFLRVDTTAGDVTITLTHGTVGANEIIIKKVSSDANIVIIDPASGTIDGAATRTLIEEFEYMEVKGDGTTFHVIG
jgi:hypothetical protein